MAMEKVHILCILSINDINKTGFNNVYIRNVFCIKQRAFLFNFITFNFLIFNICSTVYAESVKVTDENLNSALQNFVTSSSNSKSSETTKESTTSKTRLPELNLYFLIIVF